MDNNVLLIDTFMFGFATMGLIHAVADTYLDKNRVVPPACTFIYFCCVVSYYGYRVYYREKLKY